MIKPYKQSIYKNKQSIRTVIMQVSSIAIKTKQKALFQLMSEVLCLAKQLKQENIFLVGQTRSGKSTLFNWIVNNRLLIGTGQAVDPVYQVVSANASANMTEINQSSVHAQVKEGYKSVTLLPNIFHLSKSLGLVDLPGTRDQRSQIHVMIVSYIYNVFLKSSKRAKFVLVISNEGFISKDSTKIVSLITMFIKIFNFADMKDQQRQQLWKSVSLLVTSVPIEQGKQGQMKANYLKQLARKLSFLKQLKIYQKIGSIFPYIQSMVNNIIQYKRLEIFPKAKCGQFAQPSEVLRRFDNQGWKTCQLQFFSQSLRFPYAQQFLQLTSSQQQNLRYTILTKIYDFKKLQDLFSQLINKFLQKPFHYTYKVEVYQEVHKKLQELYLQNLIQNADCREQQRMKIDQFESETSINHSPIFILKNIFKLYRIGFEMDKMDGLPRKNKFEKFNFLQEIFIKCFDWLISAFALTKKSKYVLQKIKDILSERFTHFMYISVIQIDFESTFIMNLKQYIHVENQCDYNDYQLVGVFCKNANQEEEKAQLMEIEHVQQFVQFLSSPQQKVRQKVQSLEIFLKLCSKLYKSGAQKYSSCQPLHKDSVAYYLKALIHLVKLKMFYKIQLQHSTKQNCFFHQDIIKIDEDLNTIRQDLSVEILEMSQGTNFIKLQQLYKQSKIICYILQVYQKYSRRPWRKPQYQPPFLENYAKLCEAENHYKTAFQLYRRLADNRLVRNKRNEYLDKKARAKQKISQEAVQKNKEQITIEQYLTFAQLTYSQILRQNIQVQKSEWIYTEIKNTLAKKLQTLQQGDQFTVELPQKLSNYDIIVYSRYLVSKISNRKTIILLGNKAGKSTASYWLRNKKLVQYNHQIDIENRQTAKFNSIKHRLNQHTEVPNIYALNSEQLLVDAPHIYDKNLQRMLIVSHFLQEVIDKSSSSKFLLLVKQQDILMNHCITLVQMIQYYIRIFGGFQNKGLEQNLALMVTFINPKNNNEVRKKLHQLYQLFKCEQNDDVIEQRFKLSKAEVPCTSHQIFKLLRQIREYELITSLDILKQYKQNVLMVHQIGLAHIVTQEVNHWKYSQVKSKIGSGSSFDPFPLFRANIIQGLHKKISDQIDLACSILRLLTDTLIQFRKQDRDRNRLDNYLHQLEGKLITADNWFIQERQRLNNQAQAINLFRYAELPKPKIQKIQVDPLASHLRLFLTFKISETIKNQVLFHQYQIVKLKDCIKKIYSIYLQGCGSFTAKSQVLEIALKKVWQILTELQIIRLQSKSRYSQTLCDLVKIKDILCNLIQDQSHSQQIIAQQFLKLIEQQLKQAKKDTKKIDLIYQILNTVKKSPVYKKTFNEEQRNKQCNYRQIANRIINVQQLFIKQSPNDKQVVAVLIEQSSNYISPKNSELFKDKSLKLTLEEKIKVLCQKLATFDPKSALEICDQLQNNELKKKIFEIMQRKQLLNHNYFQLYYDCLIQNGDNSTAYMLIEIERENGRMSEQQYELKKRTAYKDKRDMRKRKEVTLEELMQIIKNVKKNYFGQQSQQQLDS